MPHSLLCKWFLMKSVPHPLFFPVAWQLCLMPHPYPWPKPHPRLSLWTQQPPNHTSEHSLQSGSDETGRRSKSEGHFGQSTEPGETDKILNKWDNHNAIARGWGGVKENYHPVTFRGIYNVDTQKNFTSQNLWQVLPCTACHNWSYGRLHQLCENQS